MLPLWQRQRIRAGFRKHQRRRRLSGTISMPNPLRAGQKIPRPRVGPFHLEPPHKLKTAHKLDGPKTQRGTITEDERP